MTIRMPGVGWSVGAWLCGIIAGWVRFAPAGEGVGFCCAALRRVARVRGEDSPQRRGGREEDGERGVWYRGWLRFAPARAVA
jgi:hypothetical protein